MLTSSWRLTQSLDVTYVLGKVRRRSRRRLLDAARFRTVLGDAVLVRAAQLFTGQALSAFLAFPASVIVARMVGPRNLGKYAIVIALVGLIVTFLTVSMPYGFAQQWGAAESHTATRAVAGSALCVAALQAALLGGVGIAAAYVLVSASVRPVVWLAGAFLCINIFSVYVTHCLRARLAALAFSLCRLVSPTVFLITVISLWLAQIRSLLAVLGCFVAAQAIQLVASMGVLRRQGLLLFRWSSSSAYEAFRFGLRGHLGIVGDTISKYGDQLIIPIVLPVVSLGRYSVAASVAGVISVAAIGLTYLAQPLVQRSGRPLADVAAVLLALCLWVLIPVAVVAAVVAPWAISVMYGPSYSEVAATVRILCMAALPLGLTDCLAGCLLGAGAPGHASSAQGVSLGLTLIGLPVALSVWGIKGAAVTSMVSYVVAFSLMLVLLCRRAGRPPQEVAAVTANYVVHPRVLIRELNILGQGA